MKALLALATLVVSIAPTAYGDLATEPIEAAIAEIMAHPDYRQLCSKSTAFESKIIPLPVYTWLARREYFFTPQQLKVLQDRRAELVLALKKILANLHPEKPAPAREADPASDVSHLRPDQLNTLHLFMVSDLHLIETLPELLELEARLRGAIQRADDHPEAPPPDIARDDFVLIGPSHKPTARESLMDLSRLDHREILSLMLRLLREQQFPPLLESEFEKRYQEKRQRVFAEGISGLDGVDLVIPFSSDVRDKIRELARQYLAEHAPAK